MRRNDLCAEIRARLTRLPAAYEAITGSCPPLPEDPVHLGTASARHEWEAPADMSRLNRPRDQLRSSTRRNDVEQQSLTLPLGDVACGVPPRLPVAAFAFIERLPGACRIPPRRKRMLDAHRCQCVFPHPDPARYINIRLSCLTVCRDSRALSTQHGLSEPIGCVAHTPRTPNLSDEGEGSTTATRQGAWPLSSALPRRDARRRFFLPSHSAQDRLAKPCSPAPCRSQAARGC